MGREFDRAQVLDALGDVHLTSDPSTAHQYYLQAAQIYEKGGHLVAAATTRQRADDEG